MQEYKFRCWDEGNKFMYQPALKLMHGKHPEPLKTISPETPKPSDSKNWTWLLFTGSHDKNGVEIYEGDIVEWQEDKCEVCFIEGSFCINPRLYWAESSKEVGQNTPSGWHYLSEFLTIGVEVIGNIYENPELLK